MKMIAKIVMTMSLVSGATSAIADVTCTADAGSATGPYYTVTAPTRDEAYSAAYEQAITFVNMSDRNPAYLTVTCNQ